MADFMAKAGAYLEKHIEGNKITRVVEYRRGAESAMVQASLGRSQVQIQDSVGAFRIIWTDRDYIIPVDQLKIDGVCVEPQVGDRIVDDEGVPGGESTLFELLSPQGAPPWRWSDPQQQIYRIHTKRLKKGYDL